MIRVARAHDPPQVLAHNAADWTEEYLKLVAGDESVPEAARTRYRHPDIKAAVKNDAHDKCVYCESYPTHVHPGDIDHVLPKSKRPELVVAWDNLVFACQECDREKGDYLDSDQPLVDPLNEDPADFIWFYGPMVLNVPGSDRGLITIRQLKLDRPNLLERRKERIATLHMLADRWARMAEGPAKDAVRSELLAESDDDREYAAAARAFLTAQAVA